MTDSDPLDWLLDWRAKRQQQGAVKPWRADMFPEQLAFVDDSAKAKAAVCGRRSGKTWACVVGLYEAALAHQNSLSPYIGLSAKSTRNYFWPTLREVDAKYSLGIDFRDHELVAKLPNGSQIFAVGGDDRRKVEALRGGKYPRVVIDEAASFPRDLLKYLCDDVLEAALMDLDGDMWLIGSPNAACVGHFHDVTTGKNPEVARITTHHWCVLQNRHMPHAARYLAGVREKHKWTEDNPVYRREYLGHWVRDTSSLVFRFDRARHIVERPEDVTECVIGVDLGASAKDATTAFVVCGWARYSNKVYVLHASKLPGLTPATGADELRRLMAMFPKVSTIVVDAGGLGAGYVEDWRKRESLPVKAAEKRDKLGAIKMLNGELDAGNITLVQGKAEPLAGELDILQWDEDRDDYDDRFPDHCADSWLYSWRECYAWAERAKPKEAPLPGSPAALDEEQRKQREKALREARERDRAAFKQMARQLRSR